MTYPEVAVSRADWVFAFVPVKPKIVELNKPATTVRATPRISVVVFSFIKTWIALEYIEIMEFFRTKRFQIGNLRRLAPSTHAYPKIYLEFSASYVGLSMHILVFVVLVLGTTSAYAFEPIPITISGTMNNTEFDGKWTFEYEWKPTSLNTYDYDDYTQIILRSAHQEDYAYLFLDPITDIHPDELEDYAIVCFDTNNDKTMTTDENDFCFSAYLNGNSSAYRGGNGGGDSGFVKIPDPDGFVGKSTISDHNDRYTPVPHPSFEFRIPLDLIGRENVYGFHFVVYDAHSQRAYTYPQNTTQTNFVAGPDQWGEIYSPDKSLPEFGLPMALLMLSLGAAVLLVRIKHRLHVPT